MKILLLLFVCLNLYATNDLATQALNINAGAAQSAFPLTRGTSGQFLQTNGSGTLSWAAPVRVTKLIDYATGPMPLTSANYTTIGGNLRFDVSGSCNPGSISMSWINFETNINAAGWVNRGQLGIWTNVTNAHVNTIPRTFIITGVAAASNVQVRLSMNADCNNDVNDFFDVTVTEY